LGPKCDRHFAEEVSLMMNARVLRSASARQALGVMAPVRALSTVNAAKTNFDYVVQHKTSQALAVAVPLAVIAPQMAHFPLDIVLATAVPAHMVIGMSAVVTDYAPKAFQGPGLLTVRVIGFITLLGLLKLSLNEGLLNTVKELWAPGSYVKRH
jgi:hypothetical protein